MVFVKLLKDSRTKGMATQPAAAQEPPDPLADYLRQWGLEMYIPQFKEQAIDLETLQMLSENDVKELIPVIGHRAKLNTQIKLLRSLSALPITYSQENMSLEMISENQLQPSSTSQQVELEYVLQHLDSPSIDSEESGNAQQQAIDTSCELYKILKSSNEGKSLLLRHRQNGLLNNADRRRLCNIIISNELKDDPEKKVTSTRLYALAYDIPKVFIKENSSVYFIPYMSITPMQKVSAKGKLLDCYRQRRREFIKSGVIAEYSKRRKSTSAESESPRSSCSNIQEAVDQLQETPTEDVHEKLLWLNNCCDPWATVETYWDATTKQRLTRLMTDITVEEYIRQFKPLSQPGGVLLLMKDFKVLHPQHNDNLYQNWLLIRPNIIDYAQTKQDSALKEILSNIENDNEEILNVVGFMTLPFLMTTSIIKRDKAKKQWRPSKYEVLQSFICHLKSAAEIEETIQRRKTKLQELGMTLQPFIVLVGPSIKTISARYIVLNNIRYELPSILKSVDACFKLIFALNAEYPAESKHIWQFIQKAVFKINTKFDKIFTTVRALATDLGIELQ